jgi:hypothetical protein
MRPGGAPAAPQHTPPAWATSSPPAGPASAASPATGSHHVHEHEQELIVEQALTWKAEDLMTPLQRVVSAAMNRPNATGSAFIGSAESDFRRSLT